MGRYYSGDIEGKFWFGIQASNDADFFGVAGIPPGTFLEYNFEKADLGKIKEGIKKCEKELGPYKEKLDKFFGKGGRGEEGYNNNMIAEELKIEIDEAKRLIKWYARILLGLKIQKCVEKKGECHFQAEC